MDTAVAHTVGLLVAAIGVAILARRLRLPYTVGLVIAGVGLAVSPMPIGIALTQDFIFNVALPPLLFEAALVLPWPALRRDALPILTLATLGTVIAAVVVAGGMVLCLGWAMPAAAIFGVLIAATDPVAVIAMFKDIGVKGRLRLLVESESLLNDGVAAVLFVLVLTAVGGGTPSAATAAMMLAVTAGGGILVGLLCAGAALLAGGRTADRMVETALTVVVAYGSFLGAEALHLSGVLACVAAGLLMGNASTLRQGFVTEFWDFAAFLANSLVFILIGVTLAHIPFTRLEAWALPAIIAIVLLGRAMTVYPLCLAFRWSRWPVPMREQHVLWWGGLRGALGLALALRLPESMPDREPIVIATFAVVAFSVVAQGGTMRPLLRRLGIL